MPNLTPKPFRAIPGFTAYQYPQDRKSVRVKVEVPGMEQRDAMVIRGEKRRNSHDSEKSFRAKCTYGFFHRRIPLPDYIKPDDAKAT